MGVRLAEYFDRQNGNLRADKPRSTCLPTPKGSGAAGLLGTIQADFVVAT
jgi:hypothetical protein